MAVAEKGSSFLQCCQWPQDPLISEMSEKNSHQVLKKKSPKLQNGLHLLEVKNPWNKTKIPDIDETKIPDIADKSRPLATFTSWILQDAAKQHQTCLEMA